MMKTKNHRKFIAFFSGIFITVFNRGAGHFSYCDNFCISAKCSFVKFFKIAMYVGTICIKASAITLIVVFKGSFTNEIYHIKTKSLYSFFHPKFYNFLHFLSYFFIIPV